MEKVTYGANASYVNVSFVADVLYTLVNMSSAKWNMSFFTVLENDMTFFPK